MKKATRISRAPAETAVISKVEVRGSAPTRTPILYFFLRPFVRCQRKKSGSVGSSPVKSKGTYKIFDHH